MWQQLGYGSYEDYTTSKDEAQASADRLNASLEALASMQAESAVRMEEMAAQSLAYQQDALDFQKGLYEEDRAARKAEEQALEEKTKRRMALLSQGGGSLLTGGQGATGQLEVGRKSLLGA